MASGTVLHSLMTNVVARSSSTHGGNKIAPQLDTGIKSGMLAVMSWIDPTRKRFPVGPHHVSPALIQRRSSKTVAPTCIYLHQLAPTCAEKISGGQTGPVRTNPKFCAPIKTGRLGGGDSKLGPDDQRLTQNLLNLRPVLLLAIWGRLSIRNGCRNTTSPEAQTVTVSYGKLRQVRPGYA
jgi:hypothetical protein